MIKKTKRILTLIISNLAILIGVWATSACLTKNVNAVSTTELHNKALVNGLAACYINGGLAETYDGSSSRPFFVAYGNDSVVTSGDIPQVYILNGIGNEMTSPDIKCKQLFNGSGNKMTGIFGISSKEDDGFRQPSEFGYVDSGDGQYSQSGCLYVTYKVTLTNDEYFNAQTNEVCFPLEERNGKKYPVLDNLENIKTEGTGSCPSNISSSNCPKGIVSLEPREGVLAQLRVQNAGEWEGYDYLFTEFYDHNVWTGEKWDFETAVNNCYAKEAFVTDAIIVNHGSTYAGVQIQPFDCNGRFTNDSSSSQKKLKDNKLDSAAIALQFLLGSSSFDSYKFTKDDWLAAYVQYYQLRKHKIDGPDMGDCKSSPFEYSILASNGQWCRIDISNVANEKVGIRNPNSDRPGEQIISGTFADAMKDMAALGAGESSLPGYDTPIGPDNPNNPPSSTGNDAISLCFTHANSLGWILCPVLKFAGDATQFLYTHVVEGFLIIKAELLDTNGGPNSVYDGWARFRNIANIIFAIAFVIVILAQVTGIGITNYNIKKTLPRLIVVVVLINISFIICQLAVDVSNILGSELYRLFSSWAETAGAGVAYTPSAVIGEVFATLFTGAAAVGAVALAANTWEYWLLPLLLAILGCLIGIIFFFIILGVRQAGVIILIVLAPAAIVCYALPNTKSLFDKWRKLFTSLLLVYPICGALMGGTQYASALLIKAGGDSGFFFTLAAMLLSVVPFFLVPGIVRKSMDGIAGLGSKIQGFGQRLGGSATRALRNSNMYREEQRNLGLHNDRRVVNRLSRRRERNGGQLSDRAQRRLAMAQSRSDRGTREDIEASIADGQLLSEDPTRVEALRANASLRAQKRDTEEAESLYQTGNVRNFGSTSRRTRENDPSDFVDVNDINSLAAEHLRLLTALDEDPNNREAGLKLRALQNLMVAQGDTGLKKIDQNFKTRLRATPHTDGQANGLSLAANHLASAGDIPAIKKANRGLYSMVTEFGLQQYNRSLPANAAEDASPTTDDIARYYDLAGDADYTAETIGALDQDVLHNIYSAMRSNPNATDKIRNFTSLANEALSNPNIRLQGKAKKELENIASLGYGQGAIKHGANKGTHTIGSAALAQAGAGTLDTLNNHIRNLSSNGPIASTSSDYKEIQNLAENARRALEGPDVLSQETSDKLQQILSSADEAGVLDLNSNAFGQVDSASIRIRGATPTAASRASTLESQYRSGSINALGSSTPLNINHMADVKKEHTALLSQLASTPGDTETLAKVQAIQNIMSSTAKGQAALHENFIQQLQSTPSANQQQAITMAASHLNSSPSFSTIASNDSGLGSMIIDLSQGNYGAAGANVGQQYDAKALQNISVDTFSHMGSNQRERLIKSVQNGSLGTDSISSIARMASSALSDAKSSQLTQTTINDMQSLLAESLGSRTPVAAGSGTSGSVAMKSLDSNAINDVSKWIRQANSGVSFAGSNTANPTVYGQIQRMAENAQTALKQSSTSAKMRADLEGVLSAAKDMGVKDATGKDFKI